MSVKPILFKTSDEIRAILDGRKTVTRRLIKESIPKNAQWGYTAFTPQGKISCRGIFADGYGEGFYNLPYQPGDILYVRETWAKVAEIFERDWHYEYRADTECEWINKWRPSIHMPKEAARIWLKVTDLRVERLQDMWASDTSKEGMLFDRPYTAREMLNKFSQLWDSTIKKKNLSLYGWESNPWVWVIEFERTVKPNESSPD